MSASRPPPRWAGARCTAAATAAAATAADRCGTALEEETVATAVAGAAGDAAVAARTAKPKYCKGEGGDGAMRVHAERAGARAQRAPSANLAPHASTRPNPRPQTARHRAGGPARCPCCL